MFASKKSGSLRSCVDYQGLNAATRRDLYWVPHMDLCIDAFRKAVILATQDGISGYCHVAVEDTNREGTAFTTTMNGTDLRACWFASGSHQTFSNAQCMSSCRQYNDEMRRYTSMISWSFHSVRASTSSKTPSVEPVSECRSICEVCKVRHLHEYIWLSFSCNAVEQLEDYISHIQRSQRI